MTSVTTNAPFPPIVRQIAVGAGTITKVCVVNPIFNDQNPFAVQQYGSFHMDCTLYDATSASDKSTPIISFNSQSNSADPSINVPFTKGLFIEQRSTSSITVAGSFTAYVPPPPPSNV